MILFLALPSFEINLGCKMHLKNIKPTIKEWTLASFASLLYFEHYFHYQVTDLLVVCQYEMAFNSYHQ